MHILSVELENIKRHAKERFDFTLGTNAISGPNGAGKSTILESIGYALFDSLPYKKEDFLKRGASVGTVRVTFESSVDQREYTVVRNTRSTYYVFDPETKTRLAEQKVDVLAWLREHMGLEPDTNLDDFFRTTIGVPQGTLTSIFLDTATRRKAVFDQILRVEEYRRSSDALKETGAYYQQLIAESDKSLANYQGRLLRLDDLEVQEAQLETERQSTHDRLGRTSSERALWETRLGEYEALAAAIAQDQVQLADLATRHDFLNREHEGALARATESEQAVAELAALLPHHEAFQAAEKELLELQNAREKRDALKTELAECLRQLHEAQFTWQTLEEQLRQLDQDAAEFDQLQPKLLQQEELEKAIASLKSQQAEAKLISERVERTLVERETWEKRYLALVNELAELDGLKGAPERVKELETTLGQLHQALQQLQEAELLQRERETRRKWLDESLASQARAISELEQLQGNHAALRDAAAPLDDLTEQGQALRDQLSAVEAEQARDRKAASEFGKNLCPIFSVSCPHLEGQSPEVYFQDLLATHEAKVKTLNDMLSDLRQRWKVASDANKQLAALEGIQTQLEEARERFAKGEAERTTLLQELQDTSLLEKERAKLEGESKEVRTRLSRSQEEAARFAQRPGIASQLEAIAKEQAERDLTIAEDRKTLEGFADLSSRLKEAESALAALGDPRAFRTVLERRLAERPKLEAERTKQGAIASELTKTQGSLQDQLEAYSQLDQRFNRASEKKRESEAGHQRYLAIAPVAQDHPTRQATLAASRERLEILDRERQELEEAARRRAASYHADEHAALRERVEGLKAETIRLEQAEGFLVQQLEATRREMAEMKRLQSEMKEAIAAREKLVTQAAFLDFARAMLKEAGPYVTEVYLLNISLEADRLFREITGLNHVHLRWSNDYEILLEEEGRDRSFLNLSGGEQMVAALAVRLALLKETSSVHIAFFDEPTTNMDESRRANLALQIGQITSFKQLFVISHDDSFEQFTDHVVRIEGGSSSMLYGLSKS